MQLIPAIDLKEGKCVRLRQGLMEDATVFSDNPVEMAQKWVDAGAKRLHLVDLDGAFAGKPENYAAIKDIVESFSEIDIQIGGGIRDIETAETYLDLGLKYIIIGTKAVQTPHFVTDICAEFPGSIIVGLDAKGGKVAVDGWSKLSTHNVIDMAQEFEDDGVESIIFTDIGRDGMMKGVNIDSTVELAEAISIPVIASGGVSTIDDVKKLIEVADAGIEGAIIGRALYEGSIDFAVAQKLALELTED
ncbi:MAG: 1-(5-phosphoribosyl)-5-[(5-phosphoribosylamino)methylideneamino]imidazole-4-carboxamide isomerase [Gammaproteobacteria bacterium]|nr:MAG: 1-(5-phosphoribosyl)-5-[(5-phosphoribosylamino)methylideneamino]imidazole-4-carboxamide isomerase [Gammaproteobacteria bacterium]